MFKHIADSIKETPLKRFITQADKDKYDGYSDRFRAKNDTYSKEELQWFINEFDTRYETVEGSVLKVDGTKRGLIKNIEVFGNTVQNDNDLSDIKSVGIDLGDGRYELKLLVRGVNLFNKNSDEILIGQKIMNPDGGIVEDERYNVSHYIPVNGGEIYLSARNAQCVAFYDIYKQYISKENITTGGIVLNLDNVKDCRYIRFNYDKTYEDTIHVEFGTSISEYNIYEDQVKSLILPCELRKVGEYADKIVKIDGRWFIEKNIQEVIIDGTWDWGIEPHPYYKKFVNYETDFVGANVCISSKYKYSASDGDYINCRFRHDLGRFVIATDEASNVDEFKALLTNEPLRVLYVAKTPEYIELSESQEIILNSFNDKTSIFFLSVIQGSIKCEVPITTGASVESQVDSINTLLDEIEQLEKLAENTNTTVESNKGMISIPKTNNGYVSDVFIEGRTLVNLHDNSQTFLVSVSGLNNSENYVIKNEVGKATLEIKAPLTDFYYIKAGKVNANLKDNTKYTLFFEKGQGIENVSLCDSTYQNHLTTPNSKQIVNNRVVLTTNSSCSSILSTNKEIYIYLTVTPDVGEKVVGNVIMVEGDHTDKDISFFEGLKSVGDSRYHIKLKGVGKSDVNYDFVYTDITQDILIRNKSDKLIKCGIKNVDTGECCRSVTIDPYNISSICLNAQEAIYVIALPFSEGWDNTVEYNSEDIYEIDLLNGISVISVNNGNLIPKDVSYTQDAHLNWKYDTISTLEGFCYTDYIRLNDVPKIRVVNCNKNICFYREDKTFIPYPTSILDTEGTDDDFYVIVPKGAKYFRITIPQQSLDLGTCAVYVANSEAIDQDKIMVSNKQKLLYKDSDGIYKTPILRSTPNDVKDTIEKHEDGKYYYHKRCGEIILDGSEDWVGYSRGTNSTHNAYVLLCENLFKSYSPVYCNLFNNDPSVWSSTVVTEGIAFNKSRMFGDDNVDRDVIFIKVDNTKLDVSLQNPFNSWLASNIVNVVFILKKEEIYECSPIDVISYEGETNIIVTSDTVKPYVKATVRNNLNSVIDLLIDKMDLLEETMVNDAIYENRIMLASMYSTDSTSLKSDIVMTYEYETYNEPDYDLYTLILNNISVGKDNYDSAYIEEVIDFYTMVGKLSFEMADELLSIILSE